MKKNISLAAVGIIPVLLASACRDRTPVSPAEVLVVKASSAPTDPVDPLWIKAPEHTARLIPQDLVEPRQMKTTTSDVRVRAITNGVQVSFRLQWVDPSTDDVAGPARFADACAVQLPASPAGGAPAPQMGEAARPVEITFWRASWQAVVDGRGDSIRDLYPDASIDHYPFEAESLAKGSPEQKAMADRYAPARSLGNQMGGPRGSPVESLMAQGPGTLAPAPSSEARGRGRRSAEGWTVVISRRMPAGLAPQTRSQVAFAIWEGSQQEAGSRKMRTGWIPLALGGEL
jgi:hypothetical protein